MPETERPTFETAKICPKCGKAGNDRRTIPVPQAGKGVTVHLIYCETELCPWYETCWQVQVNPDGTIPAPSNHTGEKKIYAGIEGHDDVARQIMENLERQRIQETEPGAEIRRPR
jgi:hypothetical protein